MLLLWSLTLSPMGPKLAGKAISLRWYQSVTNSPSKTLPCLLPSGPSDYIILSNIMLLWHQSITISTTLPNTLKQQLPLPIAHLPYSSTPTSSQHIN